MTNAARTISVSPEPRTLVPLAQAGDPKTCGHKAASLAALLEQGFEVPPGFVIPVGLTPDPTELAHALESLAPGPFAVRSSGVAEDLDQASFAGQYETVLDVAASSVADAARRCVASAGAAHVAQYAGTTNTPAMGMAVLIQRMVQADAAGVAFSADPISGDRSVVVINAVRGLGDRLVAGEVHGDVWRVGGQGAVAGEQPHGAIDTHTAEAIAYVTRRIELLRGTAQDVEWARAGGKLFVLQARAITVLPIAPEIAAPKGTWEKDAAHFPGPVCPFAASTHLNIPGDVDLMPDIGLVPDKLVARVIGHEFYIHIEPDDGGAKPPPWWLIGIVARVLPSLRRKMRRADELVRAGYFEELPRRWNATLADEQRTELRRRAAIDLAALDDAELFAHIHELRSFTITSMQLHFELMFPHAIGVHELCRACEQLLGWDVPQTVRLLAGLSTASSAPVRELERIADLARDRPAAREVLETAGMNVVDRMREVDPEVHDQLAKYLGFWGLRTFGPDCGAPNVADRPDLIASSLAKLLQDGGLPDLEPDRQRAIAQARAALRSADDRKRFDAALACAELVYPLREDNVILTDQMVIGLVRRTGIEAGRRLVARGLTRKIDDVMMLGVDEVEDLLARGADARPLVDRRRSELAWVRANPGPDHYGAAPAAMPDLRGLPASGRRVNAALLFLMAAEMTKPPAQSDGVVRGLAASGGTYRGRVRVITSVEQLDRLLSGEVLVCPSTCAAWMMVFHRAGALVTDFGGALTHTSIVAREHRLPAVVGTHCATTTLVDGEEVIVDGTLGTVTRVS
jgi:rifampicin phosphotransferase